jgi:uncharacterized membrane protein YfcA
MLPSAVLLIAFALLMLVIGVVMLVRRKSEPDVHRVAGPLWVVLASGAGVGLLTGILGVGGGFLIVPALVMFVGLPMPAAVGTSLIIIAMNSLAGLAGHLGTESFNFSLTYIFILAGLAGTFAGAQLSKRMPAQKLQKTFAWFVIVLAVFLLADNLTKFLKV